VRVRVSATDRIRIKIDELFAEGREVPEILEELARLGAQLLMQAALEAEVTEFLGRERYQRTATSPDAAAGSRNGYRPVTVKTTTGPVTLERPKLRGTTAAFASRLFGKHVTKTNAVETLVIASFVRGLSVRDVQATLAEALGDQAAISKSTVSEVCKAIRPNTRRGPTADSMRSRWTTCFWMRRFFGCIPGRRPNRSWRPGASPATAGQSSSDWRPGRASRPTRGLTS
jgi:Transposase, Mutator family